FQTVNGWLSKCDSKHKQCQMLNPPKLPTRVIDVSIDESQENVRLVAKDSAARYAALTYCWGKSNFTVTTDTIEECMKRLPIAKMPRIIQDGIICTRRIGIQYLWVDSLCILQDSETDKAYELSRMADYYHKAYLTISAALSCDSNDGFLYEREAASAVPQWPILYLPIRNPITSRGWTLQEHLLSPRLLIYGTLDVYWSCSTTTLRKDSEFDRFHCNDDGTSVKALGNFKMWKEIVEEFSCMALTNPHDRLPALSALAMKFNQGTEDIYMAGIWSRWLVRSLAWTSTEPEKSIRQDWVAPCWSWASLDGRVEFLIGSATHRDDSITELVEVIECSTIPNFDSTRYGEVRTSKLIVRG
ncbi:HET-domain-containing protein, partial [Zopfia rhizophila CBS 207.26]